MLTNAKLLSKFNKNIFNNFHFLSLKKFTEAKYVDLSQTPKENYNKEQKAAYDNHVESFKKFTDFMTKREVYTWNDYLEQVIVNSL
jgi:hypothetical protein